jgi:regulator of protease activity HflC (stomatin/prohibitin superfamily)
LYGEGSHFIFPWDKVVIYESRVQQLNRDFEVLTRDGLTMTINVAARFRINSATVGGLHKYVGPDYADRLLIPALGSYTRAVFSQNSTDAVYTTRRASLQNEVKQAVIADLSPRSARSQANQDGPWIFVDDLLIRGMRFPPTVQAAIERKMEQYQLRQEYAYRLEKERLESERKEVEAQGIAKFQSIVRTGISDSYLRWKGIEATLALARSPNSKVVVIGSPKGGMPLIVGGDAAPPSSGREDGAESVTTEAASGTIPDSADLAALGTDGPARSIARTASPTEPARTRPPRCRRSARTSFARRRFLLCPGRCCQAFLSRQAETDRGRTKAHWPVPRRKKGGYPQG